MSEEVSVQVNPLWNTKSVRRGSSAAWRSSKKGGSVLKLKRGLSSATPSDGSSMDTYSDFSEKSEDSSEREPPKMGAVGKDGKYVFNEKEENIKRRKDAVYAERNGRPYILAGTAEQLVAFLADENFSNNEYIEDFLLTHNYFMESPEVISGLVKRFDELEDSADEKARTMVRMRIINVFKKWLENPFINFSGEETLKVFDGWMSKLKAGTDQQAGYAALLLKLKKKRMEEFKLEGTGKRYPPVLPMGLTKTTLAFEDIHPLEIARQLTIVEWEYFSSIKAKELFKCAWNKDEKDESAPNVMKLTTRFNLVSFWVATKILSAKDPLKRAEFVARFIQIAFYLLELNNFNGVMEIYCALNLSSIQRLQLTWAAVPAEFVKKLKDVEFVMKPTGNHKHYKELINTRKPPLIPFQGVWLGALTTFEEIPNVLEDGHVNFEKMAGMATILKEVQFHQRTPFMYTPVPFMQSLLDGEMKTLKDEKELYLLSKEYEPPKPDPKVVESYKKKAKPKLPWALEIRSSKNPSFLEWKKDTKELRTRHEKELKKLKELAVIAKKKKYPKKSLSSRLRMQAADSRKRSNTIS